MNATAFLVEKLVTDSPRYPDPDPRIDFSDVYRCEITMENGDQNEVCFFIRKGEEMTPEYVARILKFFAAAIERMTEDKAG